MNLLQPSQWISNYADYLLRYAMFRLNDEQLCEDLVQETFLSAYKAKDNFKGNSNEKTWLTSILKNKIIDEYRKKSRSVSSENIDEHNKEFEDGFFEGGDSNPHWKAEQAPQVWAPTAIDGMITKEYHAILHQCIGHLNENHIAILQEKYFEESSTEKICKDFNISKSNYWVMIHRINLQLRKCIEINWIK